MTINQYKLFWLVLGRSRKVDAIINETCLQSYRTITHSKHCNFQKLSWIYSSVRITFLFLWRRYYNVVETSPKQSSTILSSTDPGDRHVPWIRCPSIISGGKRKQRCLLLMHTSLTTWYPLLQEQNPREHSAWISLQSRDVVHEGLLSTEKRKLSIKGTLSKLSIFTQ